MEGSSEAEQELSGDHAQESVDRTSGVEVLQYSIAVAVHADRTILAAQEWEYGGFAITLIPTSLSRN